MLSQKEIIGQLLSLSQQIFAKTGILTIVEPVKDTDLYQVGGRDFGSDLVIRVKTNTGKLFTLFVEAKSMGQPRYVRMAASQLKEILSKEKNVYGVVGATFLSEESKNICVKEGLGYLDLAGNCRMQFNGVYIQILFSISNSPFFVKNVLVKKVSPQKSFSSFVPLRRPH